MKKKYKNSNKKIEKIQQKKSSDSLEKFKKKSIQKNSKKKYKIFFSILNVLKS